MSGHSKWAKIKRQKGVDDQKRGQEFSRLSKMVTIAVAAGKSGDPAMNPTLRLAIEKARQINMPKANIDRAIERGLGKGDGGSLEQVTYEGYGPMGVAVMVVASTDNRQRTTSVIKNLFERSGGSLGAPGSAAFMFSRAENGKYMPVSTIPLKDSQAQQFQRFLDSLEEDEDVEEIVHTAELDLHD